MVTEKKTTKKPTKKPVKKEKYLQAVGRRKTSVARVRLFKKGDKSIIINEKDYKKYFPILELQQIVEAPLDKMNIEEKFKVTVKVQGGGIHSQAEAVRPGISRTLGEFKEDFRKRLRKSGYLTGDSSMRERKKFGLK